MVQLPPFYDQVASLVHHLILRVKDQLSLVEILSDFVSMQHPFDHENLFFLR